MKEIIVLFYFILSLFASLNGIYAQVGTPISVYTPKGSFVNACNVLPELSQTQIDSARNYVLTRYNLDTIIGEPTSTYNCHGYAWHVSEGGNPVWIGFSNSGEEDIYMTDSSYIQVCPTNAPAKVSYSGTDHSAITDGSYIMFISKWNNGALVKHPAYDCPFPFTGLKYYVKISELIGPHLLCDLDTVRYSITNIPDASYSWSKSSLFEITEFNNTAIITPKGYGNGWLKVTVTTECGGYITETKFIRVGKPSITSEPPLAYYNGGTYNNVCNLQTYNTNMTVLGAPSAIWSRLAASPGNTTWTQNGNNIRFYFYNVNQTALYRISASNVCGTTSYDFGFKSINCGDPCNPAYVISPNPASNSVIITPDIPAPCEQAVAMASATDGQVTIYDKQGSVKKQKKYKYNTQIEIDVQDLTNGFYIAEIYDGKTIVKKSFIVQH